MYNIGDKVRIKENANEVYAKGLAWVSSMDKYLGQEYVIRNIAEDKFYVLKDCHIGDGKNDSDYYWFDPEWLEPAENEPLNISEDEIMYLLGD